MLLASDYHNVGELLRLKDNHRLFIYSAHDPQREYYERARVDGPSIVMILDRIPPEDDPLDPLSNRAFRSYLVLTEAGVGHVQAWERNHQYSYYEQV